MYWAQHSACMAESDTYCITDEECLEQSCNAISDKSRMTTTLLVLVLGQFGVHRFYAGKTETALSMLALAIPSWLTLWYPLGWLFLSALASWILIDATLAVSGHMRDSEGKLIRKW
jgi:TM2 domain-containing membrane protein YozV